MWRCASCMPNTPPEPKPASALPGSGDLSKTSAFQLYFLASTANESGILSFRLPDCEIQVAFRKGTPERIESSHPADGLARFLLQQKVVQPEQIEQAERAAGDFGGDLLTALLGLKLLPVDTAFEHLARRAALLLGRAVTAQNGSFAFRSEQLPPHRATSIGTRWGLLVEVVRRMSLVEIRRRLAPILELPVQKALGSGFIAELHLNAQEMRALSRVDGSRSLKQLLQTFPQDSETLERLLFLLKELHGLSFRSAPPMLERKTPDASPAQPQQKTAPAEKATEVPTAAVAASNAVAQLPSSAAPSAPPASSHSGLAELRAKVAGLKEQNHFQVLGLNEKANPAAIRTAYFRLAKILHPDTLPPNAPAEMASLKSQLFAAIGEAYRKLSNDESRANYLESLKSGSAEQVDVAQIFRAEETFEKGCALIKVKRYSEAIEQLDEAIAGNPQEGEFYAWRGYAKFLISTQSSECFREAQKDFQQALKLNERAAPIHYLLGEVARIRGDVAGAVKHYHRALELHPDYLDARRQLRFVSSKR